jgi:hypothetical protein
VVFTEEPVEEALVLGGSLEEVEVDVGPDWTFDLVEAAIPLVACELGVVVVEAWTAVNPLSPQ